jgi:ribosomal protein S12 methylthiotransferase
VDFLEEIQFERVGIFAYSPQEGTRAAKLPDDVPESLKRERLEQLGEVQRGITESRYATRIGARADALVEEGATARLPWQADDIDGTTALDRPMDAGDIVDVEVTGVDEYDFTARVVGVRSHAAAPAPEIRPRALPVVSMGAFGR